MALELDIITPEGERFSAAVDGVVLPGSEGEFGVLEGHERFLSPLAIGPIEIRQGNDTQRAASSGGFADVSAQRVTVLVETCELADQVEVERAQKALDDAVEVLNGLTGSPDDVARRPEWEARRARAEVRLQVAPGTGRDAHFE